MFDNIETVFNYQTALVLFLIAIVIGLLITVWNQYRLLKALHHELAALGQALSLYGDSVKTLGVRLENLEIRASAGVRVDSDAQQNNEESIKSIDLARSMLTEGLSVSDVSARTNISEAEVELLRQMEQSEVS